MDKVEFVQIEQVNGELETFAIIDKGNGEFASMTKEAYDLQQAEQSTPSLTVNETKTK